MARPVTYSVQEAILLQEAILAFQGTSLALQGARLPLQEASLSSQEARLLEGMVDSTACPMGNIHQGLHAPVCRSTVVLSTFSCYKVGTSLVYNRTCSLRNATMKNPVLV